MPRRRDTKLTLDLDAVHAALSGDNDRRRAVALLFGQYGYDAPKLIDDIRTLDRLFWRPDKSAPKGSGAPKKWADGDILFAWAAVEAQFRADKERKISRSREESIDRKFKSLPRRGDQKWTVKLDDNALSLTKSTAKKYHERGAALLERLPEGRRVRWQQLVGARVRYLLKEKKPRL